MPRTVAPALRTLIDSGHCQWGSTMVLTLTDGTILRLSTIEHEIDGHEFLARLSQLDPFVMAVTREQDSVTFKADNTDLTIGYTLTGQERVLDGATGMLGIIFINEDTGEVFVDDKMPGDLMAGDVTQPDVTFELVSALDSVIVGGATVASLFPWREPSTPGPHINPNDLGDDLGSRGGSGGNIRDRIGGGRYPILQSLEL